MHTVYTRAGLLLLLASSVLGCVERFTADVDPPSPRPLVVDGRITSGPGPHTVTLSRAAAFERSLEGALDRVGGAQVSIVDDDTGRQVRLRERQKGVYETEKDALIGTPGHTYRLKITLPGGAEYQSAPQEMPEPVPLDSVYSVFEASPQPRIKVMAAATDPGNASNFYRWTTRATREYPIDSKEPPFWCWEEDVTPASRVPVLDDRLIDGGRIAGRVVYSISPGFGASRINQVDVRQLTLTRKAFEFWSKVREQVEDAGDPFSAPPAPIRGNVFSVQDSTERALGYFEVAGTSKRSTVCFRQSNFKNAPPGVPPTPGCPPAGSLTRAWTYDRPSHWTCSIHRN